jgi:hypothetical protein
VGPDALQQLLDDHVPEGILLEFKRFSVPSTGVFEISDLAGVLCGMANTAGGRVISGPVPDKDERLVGFNGVPETRVRAVLQRVQEAAASVQPPVNVELHTVDAPGGSGRVVLISVVLDGSGPRQHQGRYLMRVDSTNRPMPHSMVVSAVLDARSRGQEIAGWMTPDQTTRDRLDMRCTSLVLRSYQDRTGYGRGNPCGHDNLSSCHGSVRGTGRNRAPPSARIRRSPERFSDSGSRSGAFEPSEA